MPAPQPDEYLMESERLKLDVISRMKRIEGQVRGIQRMVEAGRECKDILVQVKAVRAALHSATGKILMRYLARRHAQALTPGSDEFEELEKAIKVLAGFLDA